MFQRSRERFLGNLALFGERPAEELLTSNGIALSLTLGVPSAFGKMHRWAEAPSGNGLLDPSEKAFVSSVRARRHGDHAH
jgi:hypothetical protein